MSYRPESPNKRQSVEQLSPDALSEVLIKLNFRAYIHLDKDFCGNWEVDTSGSSRIPFHLVAAGKAKLTMPNRPSQVLGQGDFVLFPSDSIHTLNQTDQRSRHQKDYNEEDNIRTEEKHCRLICGFFEFNNRASWPLLDGLPEALILVTSAAENSHSNTLYNLMIEELNHQKAGHYIAVNELSYLLFLQLLRQQISQDDFNNGLLKALFDRHVSRALKVIHKHPEKRWSVASLAGSAAMSRSNFSKRFHQLVGMPAMQYLTAWRMHIACDYLRNTELSLQAISEHCGYESEPAFRKAFKNHYSKTPGQVRKGGSDFNQDLS